MLGLINAARAQQGLRPLVMDPVLRDLARRKSMDMATHEYFSHDSPRLGGLMDLLAGAGVDYRYAGENLAAAPTVSSAHQALMNSPGHRENILNPQFTHVGIGVVRDGPSELLVTQIFVGR